MVLNAKNQVAFLISFFLSYFGTTNSQSLIQIDQYLTHYWPILNGTMLDTIGSSHMTQGNLTSFTSDRFGNANSALALNGGWSQVSSGIYFDSPEFTISFWVYPQNVGSNARVLDFGNGAGADNILFSLSYNGLSLLPFSSVYFGSSRIFRPVSSQSLSLNNWHFIAATFNGTMASIYLNGLLKASATTNQTYVLSSLTRTKCFIGKSNWGVDGNSTSYLDELRFYSKSFTQTEIIQVMYDNRTYFNTTSESTPNTSSTGPSSTCSSTTSTSTTSTSSTSTIAIGESGFNGTIQLFNLNLELLNSFKAHDAHVNRIKSLPNGYVATCSDDKTVKIWDPSNTNWTLIQTYKNHNDFVKALEHLDSDTIVSGANDKTIKIWSIKSGLTKMTINLVSNPWSLLLLSNKNDLVCGLANGSIFVYNISDGTQSFILTGHTSNVYDLVLISSDLMASSSADKTIRVWNLTTKVQKLVLNGHTQSVFALESASTDLLLSGSRDYTIRFWNLSSGLLIRNLTGHKNSIDFSVDLLEGGETVVSGSYDKSIRVWNISTGQSLNTINTTILIRSLKVINPIYITNTISSIITTTDFTTVSMTDQTSFVSDLNKKLPIIAHNLFQWGGLN